MIEMKTVSNLSHNPLVLALVLLAGLIYLDDDKEVARRMFNMEAQIQVLNERTQGMETQMRAIHDLVKENGQQIKVLSEQVAENSKQIAILSERITRLHPELSAKR